MRGESIVALEALCVLVLVGKDEGEVALVEEFVHSMGNGCGARAEHRNVMAGYNITHCCHYMHDASNFWERKHNPHQC